MGGTWEERTNEKKAGGPNKEGRDIPICYLER